MGAAPPRLGAKNPFRTEWGKDFDESEERSQRYGRLHPVKTADLLHAAQREFGFELPVPVEQLQYEFAVRADNRASLRAS